MTEFRCLSSTAIAFHLAHPNYSSPAQSSPFARRNGLSAGGLQLLAMELGRSVRKQRSRPFTRASR